MSLSPDLAPSSTLRTFSLALGLLCLLGPLTIDLYLPAFPQVRDDLATTEAAVQLTLTATTLGFGVGQFVIGQWSDVIGRRIPLLVATAVHVAASIGAALAPDITWLIVFRLLQGIGAAGSGVIATAMARDLFAGRALIRVLARLALISGLAPVVAPVLGAQLLTFLDWRGVFVSVAVYGAAVLATTVLLVRESRVVVHRSSPEHRSQRSRLSLLLRDRSFLGVALIGGLMVSGVFTFMSTSPFVYQEVYGLDPQGFGWIFAIHAVGFVVGSQTSSRVMLRVPPQWILAVTLPMLALCGAAVTILAATAAPFGWLAAATVAFLLFSGATAPCIGILSLARHGERAGTAAAVIGVVNFGLPGLSVPLVGALGGGSAIAMGLFMAGSLTLATAVLWLVVRPRSVPSIH
ncbi:multidrug effflux MFS transporter [Microbacteriaceae bacterium VKM Ac-2855]|nr:multidrug effflux MFS transporter [Microbacteriaceae bacterium VKM Ac-2855]